MIRPPPRSTLFPNTTLFRSVLFPAVELDLGDVGALEEVGEELDELVALRRRPRGPVAGERAPRGLLQVEDVVRDSADPRPPLAGAAPPLLLPTVEGP